MELRQKSVLVVGICAINAGILFLINR